MMPSKKRKYNARFPAGRIKKIMQTDEDVGKVAHAVPIIISRSLELFVESLLEKTVAITNAKNAKTLSPQHLKQCILSESRFDFLKELVSNVSDVSTCDDEPTTPQPSGAPVPFPAAVKKPEGTHRGRGRPLGSKNRRSTSSQSAPPIFAVTPAAFKDGVRVADEAESLVKKENVSRPPVIQHTGSASNWSVPVDSGDEEVPDEEDHLKNGYCPVMSHTKPLVIDEDYDT